jgi:hypothetical protein
MADREKIKTGWTKMKSGNVLTKYKQQNPGEVKAIDAYVDAIAAGQNPAEPQLKTLFGDGFTDVVAAALTPDPPPPPPPIPSQCLEAQARVAQEQADAQPMITRMVSKMMHAARRRGTVTPPPTTQIDDLGAVMYSDHTNYSNQDKYGTIDFGFQPDFYVPLPGRCIKYSTGNQTMEGDGFTVDAATARANGWLIHDNAGNEIIYAGNRLTNPGDVDYQNDWKSRALAYLAANPGVDGLFIDNFEVSVSNYVGTSYPIKDQANNVIWANNADFQDAQIAFSDNAHKAIKDAGYIITPNAKAFVSGDNDSNNGVLTKAWIDRFWPNVTGMTIEYWNLDGGDQSVFYASSPWDGTFKGAWNEWMDVMTYVYGKGLDFYPVDALSVSDNSQIRYLRGSYLLNWNGGRGSWLVGTDFGDPWNTDLARDPCQPLSAKVAVGSCWKRAYECYTIYVNPTLSTQTPDGHSVPSLDALWIPV